MKALIVLALFFGTLSSGVAHADTSKYMVRIACVPEAGLLDVEFRYLHDSVAGDIKNPDKRQDFLSKAGFHDPHDLKFSCVLGAVTYLIGAEQGPTSQRMCGGSPEVYLTVTRDGATVLSDVVFGASCNDFPSVTRITIGDGPSSWRGRETEVCFSPATNNLPDQCTSTFGGAAEFGKHFPIDQDRVRRIVTGSERR